MEDKKQILHKSIDSAIAKGVETLIVKVLPDGYLITETLVITNPTRSEIADAIDNAVLYEFGGIDIHQGECRALRRTRKIKI